MWSIAPEQLYKILISCSRPFLRFLPVSIDTDDKRKRLMTFAGALFGIPVVSYFVGVDALRSDWAGMWIDGGLLLLLIAGAYGLSRLKKGTIVYRMVVAGVAIDFTYNAFFAPTGDSSLVWLLLFPPIAFYILGLPEAVYWFVAVFVVNVVGVAGNLVPSAAVYSNEMTGRFYIAWGVIAFLSCMFELLRWYFYTQVQHKSSALEEALENVRTLKGLLPICSLCKRIRDDKGYWNHLEEYLQEHTDAVMTHGVCDSCMKKNYPDIYKKRQQEFPQENSTVQPDASQ